MAAPALVAREYDYSYRAGTSQNRRYIQVLRKISMTIERGELALVVGTGSCGKSTFCQNLVGVLPYLVGGKATGEILISTGADLVNRSELTKQQRFQTINMVFQNADDQLVALTVEEEIQFALENYEVNPDEIRRRVDEVLRIVGMSDYRHAYVSTLSGGQKQRVVIAAMLALQPSILVLDEPTSNLDPIGTAEVLQTVEEIRREYGTTVIMVQRDVDEVYELADKIIFLNNGTVEFCGPVREFLGRYGLQLRDELGLWLPQAAQAALVLQQQGVSLRQVPLHAREVSAALDFQAVPRGTPAADPVGFIRPEAEPVVRFEHVGFSYPTRPNVLRDVDFSVKPGEMVALLGRNGTGKTTLVSHLVGLLKPTTGQVWVGDRNTRSTSIPHLARRVAYVFQNPNKQFVTNSVLAEMGHGLKTLGLSAAEMAQRVETMLREVELWDVREEHPYNLSEGQKRRLSVACMVVADPDVLVLDEPTHGQDWIQVVRLMNYARQLAETGTAVVFITHDMKLVAEYASRTIVMEGGQVILDGTPRELFARPDVLERASLSAPSIWAISRELLGEPVLTVDQLASAFAQEVKA